MMKKGAKVGVLCFMIAAFLAGQCFSAVSGVGNLLIEESEVIGFSGNVGKLNHWWWEAKGGYGLPVRDPFHAVQWGSMAFVHSTRDLRKWPSAAHLIDLLRKDMGHRHPKACPHRLDHLVSLEAFLDKSILFGFSFGVGKAEVCVAEAKLLGHSIGRNGSAPDPGRCQAVTDFPPLKEKLHIQQFLGCANWLRGYLPAEYGHTAKILGQWQKPGAEFPAGGLGSSTSAGCKAFKAIKKMVYDHIILAAFDEAAAADGSCPLEQVADASAIAVGGSVVQMSRDMAKLKVLMTHCKSLTPAQQKWLLLTQEAFAQLEVKLATRKVFGTAKTLCWTDHANLTRAQTSDVGMDSKLVRWVAEILMDGSEIKSFSGRSGKAPKVKVWFLGGRRRRRSRSSETSDRGAGHCRIAASGARPGGAGLREMEGARLLFIGFLRALPGLSVAVRGAWGPFEDEGAWGPFEDEEGFASHFDGSVGRLTGTKKIKRLLDLLTSCAKVLGEAVSFGPQFVGGVRPRGNCCCCH